MTVTTYEEAADALVDVLADRLGVDQGLIRSIDVRPGSLEVTLYETNVDGAKFIDSAGAVATLRRDFPYQYSRRNAGGGPSRERET